MTDYGASGLRVAGTVVAAMLFGVVAVFMAEQPPVVRIGQGLLALGLLPVAVAEARWRVRVGTDEIAVRRAFGAWFRAAPRSVTVTWKPITRGLGRGHGWALVIARSNRKRDAVMVPLTAWPRARIEALSKHLSEVTGSSPLPP